MVSPNDVRFASFNVSLFRDSEGELIEDLSTPDNSQGQAVAEIIQRVNPDVLLLNEFDYDPNGEAAQLFQENYLSVSQNGIDPVDYPYVYLAPSNTGIASGFDFDNNGEAVTELGSREYGNDAYGFGVFPGQYAMVLYSKYPIVEDQVRTFQTFLWQDMPEALLPDAPNTPEPNDWYSEAELEAFRLSSKNHWDVPINVDGETVHVLASHPTPPVFDGTEDRNGRRNHDEIRFWADYITPGQGDYIYDDEGNKGGLPAGERFVVMGDQNADPFDGDSTNNAILQLLDSPQVNVSTTPRSAGGPDAAARQNLVNDVHLGNPALDTADFNDTASGNLRVDYALPSQNLDISDAGVFWTPDEDPRFSLVGDFDPDNSFNGFPSSDHRLVYVDVAATDGVSDRRTVEDVEFLGDITFATGFQFADTEVGGLSGLTYDPTNQVYYALSDDRSSIDAARFYTLDIDLSDASLDDGDVTFTDVTTLLDRGEPFPEAGIDPEGIAYSSIGSLFISSEGDASQPLAPFVNEFSLNTGEKINELPVPEKFLPTADGSRGVQNNLAFESLTITPNNRFLYTATENALVQDGSEAAPARILRYDLTTNEPGKEFLYFLEEDVEGNGLVELLALDDTGTLLALERGFSPEVGNTLRLFEVQLQNTTDVSDFDSLLDSKGEPLAVDAVAQKRLLLDFGELGIGLDNSEALALGPTLPDGRRSLLVASDNNFNDAQTTQFLAFALDLDTIPTVAPTLETPPLLRYDRENPDEEVFDADDPAIYVHPTDPDQSIVITSLKNGGFAVYDLQGQEIQLETPQDIRYNNVDLVYGFNLGDEKVDLAVFSDRANDTLAIYRIDPHNRQLTNITSADIPATIFGVDDGEQTAYGLATYTSPSGTAYAFVSQSDGNQVAQLKLVADGETVDAEVVRTLDVPVPDGVEPEDAQVEGMVVDRELGYLYVAQEEYGILKYGAEPNSGKDVQLIVETVKDFNPDSPLEADVEGLTLYYGEDGSGYLLASSQGNSTFAVYDRSDSNSYLGRFAIDGVEESDGADVINVPLGKQFSLGLLVVHDGSDEPEVVLQDPKDGEIQNFSTNFKYVNLADFAQVFSNLPETEPSSFDPRNPTANTLINDIASGDTTQDSTVLWAHSTFPGEITFDYATDPDFNSIAGSATAIVTDINLPVKVEVSDLTPGTDYFYRVTDAGGATAIGQFETAAELGSQTGLRFGVTGDWRGELAPYPAIQNAPDQDLAFFVEHGDTIYADIGSDAVKNADGTLKEQVVTLDEYRAKHDEVYSDNLGSNTWGDLRSSTSILATIDDHEVINDFAGGAPADTDPRFPETQGLINDTELYENGLQAFQEYNPLRDEFYAEGERTAGERKLYRYNTYGSDAATFVLDTRSFRDESLEGPEELTNADEVARVLTESLTLERTLLGEVQLNDLKQDLLTAQADGITWKFVMVPEPAQNLFPGIQTDSYEGYGNERTELLRFVEENSIDNVVFVAADVHATFVNNLTYQEEPFGPQIPTSAFEITTGAVTFDPPTGEFLGDLFTADNPELQAVYESLPVAPDADDIPNDKDDFIKQAINDNLLTPLGFDPLGLDNNLPQAEGLVDATLLQGDYVAAHTYGWTQFDIDPITQKLTVTTYGIDAYSEEELLADPQEIINRVPGIVSQFEVKPSESEPTFGTDKSDTLEVSGSQEFVFAGAGDDLIDAFGSQGNNRIYSGTGDDLVILGSDDRIVGDGGDDRFFAGTGGGNAIAGGDGADRFWIAVAQYPDSVNTITDFEQGIDVLGISGLDLEFDDLTLLQSPDGALIKVGSEALAILPGIEASSLSAADFTI